MHPLLQQCDNLSDPALRYRTKRRFAHFCRNGAIANETTILNFRRLLETYQLAEQLFYQVNAHLSGKGLRLRGATIVAATLISAPTSATKKRSDQRNAPNQEGQSVVLRDEGTQWHI